MGYLQSCRRHLAKATPHECQKACLQYWYTQKKHEVTIQNYVCLASIGQIQRHYPIMKTDGPCLLPYTSRGSSGSIYSKTKYLSDAALFVIQSNKSNHRPLHSSLPSRTEISIFEIITSVRLFKSLLVPKLVVTQGLPPISSGVLKGNTACKMQHTN